MTERLTQEKLSDEIKPLSLPLVDLGIEYSYEDITPERARKILDEQSLPELSIDKTKRIVYPYEKYANAMKSKAWLHNAAPLIFDRENFLINGYQRLEAVILANTTVRMLVARGANRETLHVYDQHRRRTFITILESEGVKYAGDVHRALSKMARIENGIFMLSNYTPNWSRLDLINTANPEIIRASEIAHSLPKENCIPQKASTTFIAMALMAGHEDALMKFLNDMLDMEEPTTNPARMLHVNLMSILGNTRLRFVDADIALALCILAFTDYLENRKTKNIYTWFPDFGEGTELNAEGRPVSMRLAREVAPPNCGLPMIPGYPGLKNGKIESLEQEKRLFAGAYTKEIQAAAKTRDGDPIIACVHMTPETALQIINTMNDGNRRPQKSHISQIARDIRNGNWMINPDPVCFSGDPMNPQDGKTRLLNGQHRLLACIEADMPIDIPIAIGVPEEAFATFDNHAKKSKTVTTGDARVKQSSAVFQWREDMKLPYNSSERPTATEIKQTIKKHPALAEFVSQVRIKSDKSSFDDLTTGGVIAYFLYYASRDRPDLFDDFAEKLRSGSMLDPKNPIFTLRKKLLEKRKGSAKASRHEALEMLFYYWEKYKKWAKKNIYKQEELNLVE